MKRFACSGVILLLLAGPSLAQTPDPSGPGCLFPLACPGPVPPKPEPLLGPPEEQAAAEQQPVEPVVKKTKHHVHKHVTRTKAE